MELNDVSIVIVTFKSENKIFSCLDSIPQNHDIFIIENSNDINFKNKVERINNRITCILTGENKGYSAANNIGLLQVTSKYSLVLNPDTIVEKNALNKGFNEDYQKFSTHPIFKERYGVFTAPPVRRTPNTARDPGAASGTACTWCSSATGRGPRRAREARSGPGARARSRRAPRRRAGA